MKESRAKVDIVYSRDDGGWYAEIYLEDTGRELHSTPIVATEEDAREAARVWALMEDVSIVSYNVNK